MLARRLICVSLLVGSTLLILSQQATAQAGRLDPSFGIGGIVTTDFGDQLQAGNAATANAVVIQPDGRIVVAGAVPSQSGFPMPAVLRYNSNGSLDASFGSSGVVTINVEDLSFTSVALQSDGKIVAVAGGFTASIARFTSTGVLDTTFGTNGIVTLSEINGPPQSGVAIQPDGKVLIANKNIFRLLSNGQPDTSFGSGGAAFNAGYPATTLALMSNGDILTGSTQSASGIISEYQSNGALITTFGVAGQLPTPGTSPGVVLLGSGEFLSGGTQINNSVHSGGSVASGFEVSRYLVQGIADASFGTNGSTVTSVPNFFTVTTSDLAVQPSGDIVILGTASQSATTAFALARYTASGQLDTTFGNSGTVVTTFGGGFQTPQVSANGLTIQSDGKIVVVGSYVISVPHHGADTAIKVLRYLGS